MAQRGLADGALEEEHLVGQAERMGVEEVDLHLPRADLVDERVDVEFHLLAVGVDVLEQRVELVDRVDRVGLARGLERLRPRGGRNGVFGSELRSIR